MTTAPTLHRTVPDFIDIRSATENHEHPPTPERVFGVEITPAELHRGTSDVSISVGDGPDGPHGTDENALWRERAFDF